MKNKVYALYILFAVFTFSVNKLFSQNYNMPADGQTGSLNACSGTVRDPGGNSDYANSHEATYTICPSTAGQVISLAFGTFSLESGWDYLTIYNGNATNDPIIDDYTGTTSPGTIISTSTDGCLTLYFDSDGSTTASGFSASISCVPPPTPPVNNVCSGATSLASGSGCTLTAGTTFLATQSLAGCTGTANDDVWYTFTPTTTGQTITVNPSSGFDPVVQVYSGTCAALTSLSCNDASYVTGTNGSATVTGLTPGTTYLVRVYDYSSTDPTSASTFSICTQSYTPPPPNTQDCLGAIPVCQSSYSNSNAYSGTGNVANEINSGSSCLGAGEKNDVWYQFTVQTSGNLCFVINPNTNSDDYDWAVYNLSTSNCSDIYSNTALEVACDFSPQTSYAGAGPSWAPAETGNTGLLPSGSYNGGNAQVNNCPAVTAGQTFVLNVSQYSVSNDGYTLFFPPPGTAGMATIYDNVAPTINSLTSTPACGATSFTFNMSENILCSTVSTGDFTLSGPGGPYTVSSISGAACSAGATSENTFTVNVTPAITTAGTYSLCLGTAAGSVTDLCGNVAPAGCFNFTVTGPTVAVTPTNPNCSTGTGSINATASGGTGSGYTYSLNGGAFGATSSFTGLAAGTYTVRTQDGGGCRGQNTTTITIPTAITTTLSPTPAGCTGSGAITTTVAGGTPGYTYAWSPSGTGANPTGIPAGTYSVTVTDTRGCTATATTTVTAAGSVTASFTSSPNQCLNTNSFTFTNTGSGANHSWTFPSGTPSTSTLAIPTGVTWAAAGTYTVTHTASTGTCTATNTVQVTVYPRPNGPALTPVHPACGNSNGAVNVTAATGGTPTYQYNLNGGANSALTNYTGQAAGTYTVNVIDAFGCTNSSTVTLTNVPGPTAIALTGNPAHCLQSDGSITIGAVTGGVGPYTFSFNAPAGPYTATSPIPSLSTGTYSITVKDGNNCLFTTTASVPNVSGPINPVATPVNATCGSSNGSVNISPPTGNGPFTYAFNNGGSSFTGITSYTGLAPATYTYIVKDAFNCPLTASVTVANLAGPNDVILTPTDASCGLNTGSLIIGAVTGGNGTMTYSVSPGPVGFNATTSFTNLAAGTYTVSVRDGNNCTFVTNATIGNVPGPTAVALSSTNTSCGGSTGTLTIGAVTGGAGSNTYSVTPGPAGFNATTNFSSLAAGTYTVIARDANNCTVSNTVTVGNNPGPTAVVLNPVNATCGLSNGSFTIGAVTGGGGTNTYSVSPGPAGFNATTSFTGLVPNTYTVIVRDVNGCTFTSNTTIGNTAGPTAVALTPTNSTCGAANGSFAIGAVTGGTSAYTYSVSPGPAGFTSTTSYSSLAAGTFTVTVRDANACTYTTTTVVNNTAGPTAVILTPVNTSCGGTSGTLTIGAVTGGTSAYTYSVSPGPAGFNATTSFTNLGAATYTVIVRDANGCQTTSTSIVGNNPGPTAVALTPTNASCGASNGSFTIGAVTGGTAGYTYSINGSAFTGTTNYTALAAGTYTVIVRDANGCQFTSNTTINNSGGPTAVVLTPVNTSCGGNTGSFTIGAVTGGVSAFTYSVSPGPAGFNATTNFTGLAENTYTVIVRDANGCTYTSNTTVGNNPGPTAVVLNPVNATCGLSNGSFTIGAVTGGGGTNTYSVSPGPAGFNSTTSFTGLAPNTYTVTVRDVNGCTFTSNTTIGNTSGPTAVVVTPTNSTCGSANGSFAIGAVTGGTSAYTYSVSPGPAGFTGTTSYSSLAAGTFTVTVRDANACTYTTTTVVNNTAGPTAVVLTPVNTSCGGTSGTLTIGAVTGGTSAYTYSVSPGPAGFNATTSFTNLGAATYTVVVQDANGCQYTQSSVVGNNPGPTAVVLTPTNSTCGASNGSFTIGAVTGGTAGYTYSVNASAFTGTTSYTALSAGTYTVIVRDANGCQFTSNTTINNSGGPTSVVLTPVDAACGGNNGSFTIGAVTGGAGGNMFSVNGSAFSGTTSYTNLAAGTYSVIVRDANNCTYSTTTVIGNSGGPTAQAMSSTNSACSSNTGTVTFGATTGGTGIMTYSFDGSGFTGTTVYTNVAAGTYNAIVRDGNGCQFATTVTVGTVASPTDVVLSSTNSTCGNSNGSFTIGAVTGGTSAYTYSINGGAFSGTTSYNAQLAGTYTVVVRDANGCTYTENISVSNTPGPTAFAVSSTNSTCGNSNGTATAGAVTTSGSTTYQYSINGGALGATTTFTGLAAATYTLMVQDANGCQLTNTVTVVNTPGPTAQALTPVNSTCGVANGSVTIGATTGGTGLITYSFNGGAFSGTTSYTSLAAGTYTVIAQDANNCQFTQTTVVSNLPGPTALALTTVSATCGGSNGVVNVGAVTGGSGTNTYSFNGSPFTATTSYTGLIAGTYTVVVQDVNLCQFTQTVAINNSGGPSAVVVTPTNSTCGNPNGSIAVGAVTGGAGTITYSLDGGAFSSSTTYTGLTSGTHTITVSDVNGCTFAQTTTINNTDGPTAVALTSVNSTCGNSNGSFAIGAVTGGTSGYTYSVNAGAFAGTTSFTNQAAGTYTVIVRDANLCTFTANVTVSNTPGPTAFVVSSTNSTCGNSNGTATAGAVTTSGSTSFQYSINGGALSATTSYTGLAAATYTLLVQDANGCQLTNTVVVTNAAGPSAQIVTPTNATCGNANGSILIGATTGGTGLITYSFNGGAFSTTTTYSSLSAGTYTVIAQDANNCQFTQTAIVSNLAGPTAVALTPTHATCGGTNGAVLIGAVTGGAGTNTFSFNGSPFTATTNYTGLVANTYTVVVQDANTCQYTQTVAVNNSGGPTAVALTPTNSTCGNANGSISVGTVTGGAGTITYALNGGAFSTTTNYAGLAAGTYSITVSDVNACPFTQTVTVNNTAGPTAMVLTAVNSTCGSTNGSITVGAITGGTGPGYTYSVNGGGFTATTSYTGLLAGTYTLIVQDQNACAFTQTVSVLNVPGPSGLVLTPNNSTCGNANGSISLGAVTGGTSPYEYSLNAAPFVSSGPFIGLTASTYSVIIRDANLCTFTVTASVSNTAGPTAQTVTTINSTCGNANGIVNAGATIGGTAPYQFSIDGGVISSTATFITTAGTHTVLVSDANLCTFTVTATVSNTAGPTAVALTTTPTNCGNSNGTITVGAVTGGTSSYEYSINGGVAYQPSTTFLGLAASTYTVTVKDANNCTITNTVVVSNLSSPVASVLSQTNVSCFGGNNGTVNLTGTGGATPYSYTLNTGQSSGTGSFTGLSSTTYTVTITDGAGCNSTTTFSIGQPAVLAGSILNQTNTSCFGGANGSVTATETGGTGPFTYSLNGGAFGASATFTGLSATDYTVTVRDNLGCSNNIPVTITQPTQVSLVLTSSNANCTDNNGTATVVASGGTPGYTYSWTGGGGSASTTLPVVAGDYTVTVLDANSCSRTGAVTIGVTPGGTATIANTTNVTCNGANNGSLNVSMGGNSVGPFSYVWTPNVGSSATVNNLAPGTYSVVVTDSHGCIANTSGTISEPVALSVNFTSTNVSCNAGSDGTINPTVNGGTPTYSYLWSPGAFNTGIISGLPAGTYTLTATDAQGCVITGTRVIAEPTALVITPTIVDPHCQQADGSASVTGSGGAGGYTYAINGGAFGSGSFTALSAGTYTITIKDGNQCTSNLPLTLVDQAGPVATITASTNVSCKDGNNGSATVTATGGVTPYFYTWNPTSQTTQTANNLIAGVYGVTVTDASGCAASASVIITEPSQLVINATGTDPICTGQSNGTGTSSAFGGTQPYTYQWQVLPVQNSANATGLSPGTHNVTVTDALGCTATTAINLNNPPLLTVTISKSNLLCYQVCEGSATANTTNGTSPFLYTWNDANNQTSQTASGLCAGAYTVNVVDFKGCTAMATTTITEPTLLTSSIVNPVDVRCNGDCNGSGTVVASGGTGAYTYAWTNATTTAVNTGLCAGTYTATVADANGCETQSVLVISTPNPLVITATKTNASCYNVCDGTATVSYVGGTAPYSFLWQPSLSDVFNPTALCDGIHTVEVTDANGCQQTTSVTITEPSQLIVTTQVVGNTFCGRAEGSALAQIAGGSSPFNISWTSSDSAAFSATTALINNLPSAVYNVTVTDGEGCTANSNALIQDIPGPTLTLVSSQDITCFGLNNGIGVVNSVGGTDPIVFTWLLPVVLSPNPDQTGNALWPGTNIYQAIDAEGCTKFVEVPIIEPPQLISLIPSSMVSDVTCYGADNGNATMLVTGGRAPYDYSWTGPTSITTAQALNLAAGSYTCNVVDSSGCTTSASVTITQPDPIVITLNSISQIDCYGSSNGAINVSLTGGTPAYQYNWSPNVGSGPSISSLDPGTYQLAIVDNNNCPQSMQFVITQPDSMRINVTTIPSKCSNPNASINLVVSGGTPIYTYQWNDLMLQTSMQANNLAAPAVYSCVITDGNGCLTNVTVPVNDLPPPTIDSISVNNVSCYNYTDGTATVYPKQGGGSSFTYAWYNGSNVLVGNGDFQGGLPVGTYQIIVTDNNGCTVTGATTVTQPFPLSISVSQDQVACNGQTLGIYASAAGGIPLYNYTWSGAGTGLVGGGNHNVVYTNTNATSTIQTYSVAATDANGCPAVSGQFNVTVLPKISVLANDVTGCIQENVNLEAIAGGGDGAPYTFTWGTSPTQVQTGSNSTVSVPVTSVFPVSYNLTVSDGCSTQETVIVNVSSIPKPNASLIGINTKGCADLDVAFSGSGGNGFPNCTYAWSFGDGNSGSDSLTTHTYTNTSLQVDSFDVQVIVTTPLGCSDTALLSNYIVVFPNPVAEFTFSPTEISEFEPNVNFYNQSLLGDTYFWNFGDLGSTSNTSTEENPTHSYLNPGPYDVNLTVLSPLGCRDTVTHSVYITPEFAIYVPNAFSPNSDLKNEVFAPQGIGIDEDKYNMYIYNRWGELIFESDKLSKGWDGKVNGKEEVVQIDTYIYKIIAYDLQSNKHVLTGHVTVVR